MEPFYSLEDLAEFFDFHTVENIADALRAASVPMIFNNEVADLTGWKRSVPSSSGNAIIAARGKRLWPDPDEVLVAFESLPLSWQAKIRDGGEPAEGDARISMDPRREKSLLRIIRALDKMAKLPDRGAASSVVKQLDELGFNGPDDDAVRKVIAAARALDADK